jgi:SAM-dependent methyltransferase
MLRAWARTSGGGDGRGRAGGRPHSCPVPRSDGGRARAGGRPPPPRAERWSRPGCGGESTRLRSPTRSGGCSTRSGPGTGLFTLPVARAVRPGGTVDVLDVQQEMLDHTVQAAAREQLDNVRPTRGDARTLPYPDASFDAAFLVTALGEIPDRSAALTELRRVLKPGGRLVVGEWLLDWHAVPVGSLRRHARRAGLRVERRLGPRFSYYARLRADEEAPAGGEAAGNRSDARP